jgi:DNA-binding NarL/FixJ family response regulator
MNKVLIVDDSQPIRERLADLLIESGQIRIVGEAGNVQDGWQAVQFCHPDTVILDIRLPGSTGIALLKKIKEHYPQVTVIMLTNFDDAQYRRQCRRLGADHFLNKTLEFEKIVDTITSRPFN